MVKKARVGGEVPSAGILLVLCCVFLAMTAGETAGQQALQFDGVDDYVDIGPWPELTSQIMAQPVTYEFWISSSNTTDTLTLIGAVNTADSVFFRVSLNMDGMRVRQAGGIKILQRDASGVFFRGGTASNLDTGITDGEWHHMALVFDANTGSLAIYVDGVSQELSFMDAATPTNVTDFEYPVVPIGARNVRGVIDQNFQGLLNEVRIWNYARTEGEIQADMSVAVPAGAEGLIGYWPLNEGQGTTAYDNSGYGRDGFLMGPTWTTESAPVVQPFALLPTPADGALDVPRDVMLSWHVSEEGRGQNVYVGDDLASVSAADVGDPHGVLVAQDQTATSYAPPGGFQFGRTYYWRIDEVGGDTPGRVWSFTVEPMGYALDPEHVTATASSSNGDDEGPEKTVDGSGLGADGQHSTTGRDMWLSASVPAGESAWIEYEFDKAYVLHQMVVWNHNSETEPLIGFGIKKAIVEYSLDGETWTVYTDSAQFARGTGAPDYGTDSAVDLGGVVARYVRVTALENWGGLLPQYGLSEVRFLTVPMAARQPQPVNGAVDVDLTPVLNWRAGRSATAHDVYLGTDAESLESIDTVADTTYTPGRLLMGRTYYWRVDEVNEADATPVWTGDLWSFSTQEFVTIDDFESYDNNAYRIYDVWIDGWVNETGSTVGYLEAPFAETSIVHDGRQSMPLQYLNTAAPYYSEAQRDMGRADWTTDGAETLRLYIRGSADNGAGTLYAALEDAAGNVAVVSYPDEAMVTADTWQEWVIPFADFTGVNVASVQTIYVGVGDRDNPTAGGDGLIFIDDIQFGRPAGLQ